MSTTDSKFRKLTVVEELRIGAAKKLIFRDDAIFIYSDADGSITIVTDSAIKLDANTTMQTGHQFNGAADGVVNFSKAGAISDADTTLDTAGLIGIDLTNDRIYFRIAADWSYVSSDGGASFPEKTCPRCDGKFEIGDPVIFIVDSFAEDGAVHCLPHHLSCVMSCPA